MEEKIKGYGRLFKQIDEILAARVNSNLLKWDLTNSQLHALLTLRRSPGQTLTLKELESAFHMAQSTIAGLVMRLEKKGLVESLADSADRRVKRVHLTEKGREVCHTCRDHFTETERLLTSHLTEAEQAELYRLLCLVYEAIK